ncbi:MAG: hypothetical protein COB37_09675 [Kordiimonadales bacterium]|nr:MAG: hypothetical protein COB37_09675 [Kordiimonadales bacterium]
MSLTIFPMKKFLATLLLISSASFFNGALAAERLTVIELFTSQGCSSCPPADALLKTMRDRPNMLTLSWPVDYWDRLGWEDTFGKKYHSMRQKAYNKRFQRAGVFTPQMVFDGRLQAVGSKDGEVQKCIIDARAIERPHLTPDIKVNGDTVEFSLEDYADLTMVAVRVVWYLADVDVKIGDGENQGRSLHYTNVVLDTEILEDWDGKAKSFVVDMRKARAMGADHVAVLLQDEYGHGPMVGAAMTTLK